MLVARRSVCDSKVFAQCAQADKVTSVPPLHTAFSTGPPLPPHPGPGPAWSFSTLTPPPHKRRLPSTPNGRRSPAPPGSRPGHAQRTLFEQNTP